MGGNAKHMPHIWEHLDNTFEDVFSLLESFTTGSLKVVEKFDGINMHFQVDSLGVVNFSRSDGERKAGGITFAELLTKYQQHPARKSIIEGCRVIDEHFSSVWWPFGFSGQNWLNSEILYTHRPQLLNYDRNAIVLHEAVTFPVGEKKFVNEDLQNHLTKVSSDVPFVTSTGFSWGVLPPQEVSLSPQDGDGYLTEAKRRLQLCLKSCGLTEKNSLREFLRESLMRGMLADLSVGSAKRMQLADRIAGLDAPSLVQIKKGLSSELAKRVSDIGQAKNRSKVHREAMKPIINTVSSFGAHRLKNVGSVLIENPSAEVQRLAIEIAECRLRINEASDHDAVSRQSMFNELITEYESLGGVPAAIEGVTFKWKNKTTKLTGTFSTLNQALGVDRYGRGGIAPTPQNNEKFSLIEWFGLV